MSQRIISQLRAENDLLKGKILLLEEKLKFHTRHSRTQTAKDAEHHIRDLLGGDFSTHNAGHDLMVNDTRFEIKASACSSVNNKMPLSTTRWTWHNILGNTGKKQYDHLLLLGAADERHVDKYKDPLSPYVIFDIPLESLAQFISNTKPPLIQATTSPTGQRTVKGRLFWSFEISQEDLRQRYLVKKRRKSL